MGLFGNLGKSISKGWNSGSQGPLGPIGGALGALGGGMNGLFGSRQQGAPMMGANPQDEEELRRQKIMQMLMQGGRF